MISNENELLENQIIGTFLLDEESHIHIKQLSEDLFTLKKSKIIFKNIKELYIAKKKINVVTLNSKLSTGMNPETKIYEKIFDITDSVISTSDIVNNIHRLKNINTRKTMQSVLNLALKDIHNNDISTSSIKKNLLLKLEQINNKEETKKGENMQDVLIKTLDEIEQKKEKGDDTGLYTGFFNLDKLTDGLHENELTCVGARPGVGKTAFALNIACNIASRGKNVYFCNLEMSSSQIMHRIISRYSTINTQFLRTGRANNEEMLRIASATDKILKLSLKVDTLTRYIEDIEDVTSSLKDKGEIDLLVIDYLTLIKSKEKFGTRELEVANISRKLKLLALDLNIAIIILVQLNRDAESKTPTMANIRESGSIEQNCDNIIFLHQEKEEEKKEINNMQIILEKQRQGTTGVVQLKFNKKYSCFNNLP